MIRFIVSGTRAQAKWRAKKFGINHIDFEPPGPDEGGIGEVVVGECDDSYMDQLGEWFNDDTTLDGTPLVPGVRLPPGSLLQIKNARPKVIVPGKLQ
jgi:hypothetical protein